MITIHTFHILLPPLIRWYKISLNFCIIRCIAGSVVIKQHLGPVRVCVLILFMFKQNRVWIQGACLLIRSGCRPFWNMWQILLWITVRCQKFDFIDDLFRVVHNGCLSTQSSHPIDNNWKTQRQVLPVYFFNDVNHF